MSTPKELTGDIAPSTNQDTKVPLGATADTATSSTGANL